MNLLRLLILAAVVLIGYRLISSALQRRRIARERESAARLDERSPSVRCAHCGLNLPRSEALFKDGRPYCSAEHRELGER